MSASRSVWAKISGAVPIRDSATTAPTRGTNHRATESVFSAWALSILRGSPADRLAGELLVEPGRKWREVVEDGRRVHLAAAGQRFEGVGPRAGLSHGQHRVEPLAGVFTLVGGAAVQGQRAA